jgi:hypothetical protein
MFDPKISKEQLSQIIGEMSDVDFSRFLYCQHMASTYLAIGQFEEMLLSAMLTCDRVRIAKTLGRDMKRWEELLAKKTALQNSTIGTLIKILERHGVIASDIAYLKWIKDKRDYFVHRLFHESAWPGDLDSGGCQFMIRRLMAIQHWLSRAQRNVWLIFERAGFMDLTRLADGGFLAMNVGLRDLLGPEAVSSDEDAV